MVKKEDLTIPEMIWQFFCSVKLTVYTLILLALSCTIGTVILQNQPAQAYIRKFGQGGYNLIKIFDFDNMYHAWWFYAILVVLCLNIVVCSIERLSTTWKIIFPKKLSFNPDRFRKQKNLTSFDLEMNSEKAVQTCTGILKKRVGPVLTREDKSNTVLYAEKGRWTRLGVYIVHSSVLLLLIGALIGSLYGFKAYMRLDDGASSDRAFRTDQDMMQGLGFTVRCERAEIKRYKTGQPSEYRATMTVIENGKEAFTQDVLVNHPLRYKGINLFLSTMGPSRTAMPDMIELSAQKMPDGEPVLQKLKLGQEFTLPDGERFKLDKLVPDYVFSPKGENSSMSRNLGMAFVGTITHEDGTIEPVGLPTRFSSFDRMRGGKYFFSIHAIQQKNTTEFQVTRDPGVWYVYAGFVLMIIGCWVTFFMSHQSYFIEIENKGNTCKISLSGVTNRNLQGMKLKLNTLTNTIKGQ